jgi:hypothetical protein
MQKDVVVRRDSIDEAMLLKSFDKVGKSLRIGPFWATKEVDRPDAGGDRGPTWCSTLVPIWLACWSFHSSPALYLPPHHFLLTACIRSYHEHSPTILYSFCSLRSEDSIECSWQPLE